MIASNLDSFLGKPVKDYENGATIDPTKFVYRLRVEYDDKKNTIDSLIESFANNAEAVKVEELVLGMFNTDSGDSSAEAVNKLVEVKDKLKQLKALFIGDIAGEECEISWIKQSDLSPILQAYPLLEHLQVRGGDELSFSKLQHENLSTLIIESGGLPPNVVQEVNSARLPNLGTLHLWLGSENYGYASRAQDFQPILTGKVFPKLTHLGLMNSEMQDEIASAVCNSPVLNQLTMLDLSMGTLTDTGGEVIANCEGIRKLQHLNLRHHFMSEGMMQKLKSLGISIDVSEQQEEDDEYRYAEVTE